MRRGLLFLPVVLLALPAAASEPVAITTTALGDGYVGGSYHWQLSATGGTLAYAWTALDALPPQLTLSPSGVLDGNLTRSGDFMLHVRVASGSDSASGFLPLHVIDTAEPLAIVTTALPTAFEGVPYSAQIIATGGEQPYSWHLGDDAPTWLAVGADVLSGTPDAADTAGPTTFTVAVEDGRGVRVEGQLSIAVAPALDFRVTTAQVEDASVGQPYVADIGADGGVSPYTFTVDGLPMGLSVTTVNDAAHVEGTPLEPGLFLLDVHATDHDGRFARKTLFLTCSPGQVEVLTDSLPAGTIGKAYAVRLQSKPASAKWSIVSGSLPSGLELTDDGVIQGVMGGKAGLVYAFFVQADANGSTGNRALSIAVEAAPTKAPQDPGGGGCECGAGEAGVAGMLLLGLLRRQRRPDDWTKRIRRS
jgi:hypothetical protein